MLRASTLTELRTDAAVIDDELAGFTSPYSRQSQDDQQNAR